jgi:hypothetical protein
VTSGETLAVWVLILWFALVMAGVVDEHSFGPLAVAGEVSACYLGWRAARRLSEGSEDDRRE